MSLHSGIIYMRKYFFLGNRQRRGQKWTEERSVTNSSLQKPMYAKFSSCEIY